MTGRIKSVHPLLIRTSLVPIACFLLLAIVGISVFAQEPTGQLIVSPTSPMRTSDDRVEEAIEKGNKARDEKNFSEAENQYRRALALNPNEARAYYGLGNTFFDQENYDDAVAAYKEATRLKADYAEAFNDLGFVYAKQKRYSEAIENYSAPSLSSRIYWKVMTISETPTASSRNTAKLSRYSSRLFAFNLPTPKRITKSAQLMRKKSVMPKPLMNTTGPSV
jgi:Tfp pilus assembly protein PilF